jgi:hypothetical protein
MRFAILLLLASGPGFAASWSGYLVDSKCYGAQERNVYPWDTMPHVDSDMDYQIRYCVPKAKTKDFAVVTADWTRLKFDPAGNAKAATIVGKIGKKPFLRVDVDGELNKGVITVQSISVENPGRRSTTSSPPGSAPE